VALSRMLIADLHVVNVLLHVTKHVFIMQRSSQSVFEISDSHDGKRRKWRHTVVLKLWYLSVKLLAVSTQNIVHFMLSCPADVLY
jgi:hypothetical protein